jgi:endonuclease/exonuclease/phosphatase family metal-dependent hydrolase
LYTEGVLVAPPESGPASFSVLTYNAWHGLNTGEFWAAPGERPEVNQARLKFQAAQIAAARPDVILLQEVNPLPARALAYVTELAALGLHYDVIHQVDACGIRLRGQAALVPGLNNGLAILAERRLSLRKLAGLKLSGDLGRCDSLSGVQLEELRYALIGDVTIPETGQHYLIASTHLHSGFEAGAIFLERLDQAHLSGYLNRYPAFRWEIDRSRLRRIGELDLLTRTLRQFRRDGMYAGFAIGGDFNFEPDFPEYEEARLLRLTDAYTMAVKDGALFTADPEHNRLIQAGEQAGLPPMIQLVFKGLPDDLAERARQAYQAEAARPRRIDYVWMETFFPGYCVRQKLFGTETDPADLPGSDHYGVLTTFSREGGACADSAVLPR